MADTAIRDSDTLSGDLKGLNRWTRHGLDTLLHDREIRDARRPRQTVRSIYGYQKWVADLDIVNELGGHSGCVNALSWSKSGRLLASGSDDKHLNIQRYQPDDANAQFSLATTVATGHSANIFSCKFMPHSNDQTIVTCAGDGEVRVFDIEYSGVTTQSSTAADMAAHARRRMRGTVYDGVNYLTDGSTNCRVYRSHGDRVKRIVTESSPHLFLSCSEDGEVRQWDLRLPSSAYPRPRGGRLDEDDSSVPPPLISYKRYQLDLNTISCSGSQPYYIALGGAHLHCLLHDRRMLGRDKVAEAGGGAGSSLDEDGGLPGQATRCVRKFAPHGQQRMQRHDNGHITACKISDANPNELLVSWSGEHVYGFDITRSPDAEEMAKLKSGQVKNTKKNGLRASSERKRKRMDRSSQPPSQDGVAPAESRQRTATPPQNPPNDHMAIRIQYGNGQSEDIPIEERPSASTRRGPSPRQVTADDLARRLSRLKSIMLEARSPKPATTKDPTGYVTSFTSILGYSASLLPEMKEIAATWAYPADPDATDLAVQRTLRADRDSAVRFVQACGVCARALGGRLQSASAAPATSMFDAVEAPSTEGPDLSTEKRFRYDFLRAIFLWLDSGVGALLSGFTKGGRRAAARYPVPPDSDLSAIEDFFIPFLLRDATTKPLNNIDVSRFEVDGNRLAFTSEFDAVRHFAEVINTPFADLSDDASLYDQSQSRQDALRFWGMTVARGILSNASEALDFETVSRAFGGLGVVDRQTSEREQAERDRREDVSMSDEEENIASASVQLVEVDGDGADVTEGELMAVDDVAEIVRAGSEHTVENEADDDGDEEEDESHDDDDDDDHDDGDSDDEEGEEEDEDDEEDDEGGFAMPRHFYRSAFDRRRLREEVDEDVPAIPHTRIYRGHCNVKTVKDVNYYGLQDDYVVSGSDDGNLFIWDRKTTKLLNILEGDGEVVNVVQGHPYEPMLAVSGIDDTIKIFSADSRARLMARMGRGVEAADASSFSSLSWPARIRGRRIPRRSSTVTSEPATDGSTSDAAPPLPDDEDDETTAPAGLSSRRRIHQEYQITSENDSRRQGGNQEAYITRSMLAQLAASIRRQRAEGGREGAEHEVRVGGATGRLTITDECVVM